MRHFSLLLCVLLTRVAFPQATAQPRTELSAARAGVMLLHNNQVISGTISRAGDYYIVVVDHGEIRLHSREVQFVCGNLQEAYRHLHKRIRFDNVRDRLDLAVWCERVGLVSEAFQELRLAAALNPAHPLIPLVDRRIRMALDRTAESPEEDQSVRSASPGASPEELDRMVRGMPAGVVETFTQTIQPLLTNNCTASGCHGPAADHGFRLLRIPAGQPPSRRLTQRNLHAVVKLIDRDDIENSSLLTAPIRAHGPTRAPIFTDRYSAKYQQLIAWAYLVAQGEPPPVAESPAVLPATHTESAGAVSPALPAAHVEPAFPSQPGLSSLPEQAGGMEAGSQTQPSSDVRESAPSEPTTSGVQRGGLPPEFVPADPFDPEIFNRRFFPQPPTSQGPVH